MNKLRGCGVKLHIQHVAEPGRNATSTGLGAKFPLGYEGPSVQLLVSVCSSWGCRPATDLSTHWLVQAGLGSSSSSLVSSCCEARQKPTRVKTDGQLFGLISSQCLAPNPIPASEEPQLGFQKASLSTVLFHDEDVV